MEKGRESGTSSAAYPTWDIRSENSPFAPARFSFSFTSLW